MERKDCGCQGKQGAAGRPGAECDAQVSDQIGFISEVGHSSGRRKGAPAECSVRKMAVLTVIADCPGRAEPRGLLRCLARAKHRGLLLVPWSGVASRPTGAIGLRYCWFMSGEASRHPGVSWGAPDLRPVSSVCGRWNEAKALRRCLRIAAAEWSGLQSWRVRPGRWWNSADTCPEHFRGSVGSVKPKRKF